MVNKVILIGNSGKDAELKTFDNGGQITNFPLATSEKYKNRDGELVTKTEWHNISIRGRSAENAAKFIKKGVAVYIEGKITTRSWEDKDGSKRYTTEIVSPIFQLLGKKTETNQGEGDSSKPIENDVNDLPF